MRQQTLDIDYVVEHAALAGIDQDKRTVECGSVLVNSLVTWRQTPQGLCSKNGPPRESAIETARYLIRRKPLATAPKSALRSLQTVAPYELFLDIGAAKNRVWRVVGYGHGAPCFGQ